MAVHRGHAHWALKVSMCKEPQMSYLRMLQVMGIKMKVSTAREK